MVRSTCHQPDPSSFPRTNIVGAEMLSLDSLHMHAVVLECAHRPHTNTLSLYYLS